MKTITLSEVDDSLLRKLEARASANQRTLEAEALSCLLAAVETEEELVGAISEERWAGIEQSVCDTLHDRGTPLTQGDIQRYREMARGDTPS